MPGEDTDVFKIRIGPIATARPRSAGGGRYRETIAHALSFISLGLLAGLVVVRTFSQLDAGPGNRRSVALAARAIAYVIESSPAGTVEAR
jgi:hypothetical protein